jgi:hypothetical protein
LWDTTEDVFLHCGIKRRRFSSVVGYYRRGFFSLWGGTRNNLRIFYKFYSVVSHNAIVFLPLYPTRQNESSPLYPTTKKILFHCGIQWRKMIQRRMIFSNFKVISLSSDENLGRISYLEIQTNHWRKIKMLN